MKNDPTLIQQDLPDTLDWRTFNAVTDVKDQGECAAHWAMAAVDTVESSYVINSRMPLTQFSVQ